MRNALFLFLLFFFTLAAPRLAHAQDARASDAAVTEAKARFQEGVQLADAGKHEEARLKFQQAASVLKAAAVMYNLARAEQLTGHDFEAIEHYRQFLRFAEHDGTIKDAQRADARKFIADLTPKVGQVDVEAPPSARVTIDGKALEESPPKGPVAVQPGRHTIEAAFEGKLKSIAVECEAGKVTKAKIEFESGTTTEPPPAGGTGPGWSTSKIVTVASLGTAAVGGAVVFVAFRSKAQTDVDQARSLLNGGSCIGVKSDACDHASSLKNKRDSNVTISAVGLAAAAVFAAGAFGAVVLWPASKESTSAVSPLVAPGFAGASFSRRF